MNKKIYSLAFFLLFSFIIFVSVPNKTLAITDKDHNNCDFNSDGLINGDDIYLIVQRYLEIAIESNNKIQETEIRDKIDYNADLNSDGAINMIDAMILSDEVSKNNKKGDINCDGIIDANDASAVLSFYAQKSANYFNNGGEFIGTDYGVHALGDFDNNSIIDGRDATEILKIYITNSVQ